MKIMDPTTCPEWNNIILEHFDPDIFHTAEWCQVLKKSYYFTPIYFLLLENKIPVALIPMMEINSLLNRKRAVCLPFSDYCHPLFKQENSLSFLIDKLISYGHKNRWKYVEFRSPHFDNTRTPSEFYYTHDIDLTKSSSELWARLKDNNRRNIKKAMRIGLRVKFEKSWPGLKEFYKLQVITRKRHGLPPQPFKFFTSIYEEILSQDLGVIASAHYREKTIATAIFFNFNGKVLFKYGASDHIYHQLRPNNLIMWEAIEWYKALNCKVLNLGRTNMDDSGLLNYKRLWGAYEMPLTYHRFDYQKDKSIKNSRKLLFYISNLARFLPNNILIAIGKIFYKHIA